MPAYMKVTHEMRASTIGRPIAAGLRELQAWYDTGEVHPEDQEEHRADEGLVTTPGVLAQGVAS